MRIQLLLSLAIRPCTYDRLYTKRLDFKLGLNGLSL